MAKSPSADLKLLDRSWRDLLEREALMPGPSYAHRQYPISSVFLSPVPLYHNEPFDLSFYFRPSPNRTCSRCLPLHLIRSIIFDGYACNDVAHMPASFAFWRMPTYVYVSCADGEGVPCIPRTIPELRPTNASAPFIQWRAYLHPRTSSLIFYHVANRWCWFYVFIVFCALPSFSIRMHVATSSLSPALGVV